MSWQSEHIGRHVYIKTRSDVSHKHFGREGRIVAGPAVQFGVKVYQVEIALRSRETVARLVWIPAAALLVKKESTT